MAEYDAPKPAYVAVQKADTAQSRAAHDDKKDSLAQKADIEQTVSTYMHNNFSDFVVSKQSEAAEYPLSNLMFLPHITSETKNVLELNLTTTVEREHVKTLHNKVVLEFELKDIIAPLPTAERELAAEGIKAVIEAVLTGKKHLIADFIANAKEQTTATKPLGLQPHAKPPGTAQSVPPSMRRVADKSPDARDAQRERWKLQKRNRRAAIPKSSV